MFASCCHLTHMRSWRMKRNHLSILASLCLLHNHCQTCHQSQIWSCQDLFTWCVWRSRPGLVFQQNDSSHSTLLSHVLMSPCQGVDWILSRHFTFAHALTISCDVTACQLDFCFFFPFWNLMLCLHCVAQCSPSICLKPLKCDSCTFLTILFLFHTPIVFLFQTQVESTMGVPSVCFWQAQLWTHHSLPSGHVLLQQLSPIHLSHQLSQFGCASVHAVLVCWWSLCDFLHWPGQVQCLFCLLLTMQTWHHNDSPWLQWGQLLFHGHCFCFHLCFQSHNCQSREHLGLLQNEFGLQLSLQCLKGAPRWKFKSIAGSDHLRHMHAAWWLQEASVFHSTGTDAQDCNPQTVCLLLRQHSASFHLKQLATEHRGHSPKIGQLSAQELSESSCLMNQCTQLQNWCSANFGAVAQCCAQCVTHVGSHRGHPLAFLLLWVSQHLLQAGNVAHQLTQSLGCHWFFHAAKSFAHNDEMSGVSAHQSATAVEGLVPSPKPWVVKTHVGPKNRKMLMFGLFCFPWGGHDLNEEGSTEQLNEDSVVTASLAKNMLTA